MFVGIPFLLYLKFCKKHNIDTSKGYRVCAETKKEKTKKSKGVALEDLDELIIEAAEVVIKAGCCNVEGMKDTFKIGYGRAATICDQLESLGLLEKNPGKGTGWSVKMTIEQFENGSGTKAIKEYFAEKKEEQRIQEEKERLERERQEEIRKRVEEEERKRNAIEKQKFIDECVALGSNPAEALVAWEKLELEKKRDIELKALQRHEAWERQWALEQELEDNRKFREAELTKMRTEEQRMKDEELRRNAAKTKYKKAVRRQYQSGIGDISRNLAKYDAQEALADLL